ncbi:MAG: flagellar biosynthesis protein FlhB [Treponema sp.]|nr:flagellar biosynthesis protein FlhB [Treponema sp.]
MSFEEIDLQWFAAEDEGRTEEPSELKLHKAREEGRVPKSQEVNGALVLFVCVVVLIIVAPYYLNWCQEVLLYFFTRCTEQDFLQRQFFVNFLLNFARMVLPLAVAGSVAGIAANIVQNRGFIFSTKPIEPKFSNIVPKLGQYLKKTVFSFEGGFNVVKSLVKVFAVTLTAYIIIRSNLPSILELLQTSSIKMAAVRISNCAAQILAFCAVIFLAISIPDYFVQRHQFMESMKMTKQEVKQEFKEQEGDPEVKSKLESAQRELLQRNLPQAVAESDVVITNPTHFAVALKYDRQKTDSPMINAKGQDQMAQRIKQIAKENDVPMVENMALARELYSKTEVGDIIPIEYYKVIATVYSKIGYLNKK